jgi:hypothetical protein
MSLPRVRFTVRRMMAAVAIVAVVVGALVHVQAMRIRKANFRSLASAHALNSLVLQQQQSRGVSGNIDE